VGSRPGSGFGSGHVPGTKCHRPRAYAPAAGGKFLTFSIGIAPSLHRGKSGAARAPSPRLPRRFSLTFAAAIAIAVNGCSGEVPHAVAGGIAWRTLEPGLEYAPCRIAGPGGTKPCTLHIVRVDPDRAHVRACLASEAGGSAKTAEEWCARAKLAVAINAGMFADDGRSNVGYLRHGTHRNNPRWNGYRSVLALSPRREGLPSVRWVDLDVTPPGASGVSEYDLVVQNLRLIKAPGHNVWKETGREWSEAAVALGRGRQLYFLFSRTPFSMHEWNERILSLPLGIVQAMHVEGGPEASLSIHAGGVDIDLCGSYESGSLENESNARQWPIPNVLGVERRR
jgi:phosphodiester glycosidase